MASESHLVAEAQTGRCSHSAVPKITAIEVRLVDVSQTIRTSYDLVADRYAAEIGEELHAKPLDRALLDAIAELAGDGLLLDVGCGPGHVTRYLVSRGSRAVGIDLSPAMCKIAGMASVPVAVGDMVDLPVRVGVVAAIVSMYSVIHLEDAKRLAAYTEFARVLRPGGHALIAFHTSDADSAPGQARTMTDWWGHEVQLTFRFLDPVAETDALTRVGLRLVARLDRSPLPGVEHASERTYLLLAKPSDGADQ
jgi:SAM-dependent methyltransferase